MTLIVLPEIYFARQQCEVATETCIFSYTPDQNYL
jgi:hypothetical protein